MAVEEYNLIYLSFPASTFLLGSSVLLNNDDKSHKS